MKKYHYVAIAMFLASIYITVGITVLLVNKNEKNTIAENNQIPHSSEVYDLAYAKQKIKILKGIKYMKENALAEYVVELESPLVTKLKKDLIQKNYTAKDYTGLGLYKPYVIIGLE